jgi:hypothetical protein
MRTISSPSTHRWVPIGLSAVAVSLSSRFSVSGSSAIWASPPADPIPASFAL